METGETKLGGKDVEMLEGEEGKLVVGNISTNDKGKSGVVAAGVNGGNQGYRSGNKKLQVTKKNMKKKGDSEPKALDIGSFVMHTCGRLWEKKSHMVYIAVGCLGVCALNDLVEEVIATQRTADGKRHHRPCGGMLWNLIKTRHPAAYGEIMKKKQDFEDQLLGHVRVAQAETRGCCFRRTACTSSASMPEHMGHIGLAPGESRRNYFRRGACTLTTGTSASVPDHSQTALQSLQEQFSAACVLTNESSASVSERSQTALGNLQEQSSAGGTR